MTEKQKELIERTGITEAQAEVVDKVVNIWDAANRDSGYVLRLVTITPYAETFYNKYKDKYIGKYDLRKNNMQDTDIEFFVMVTQNAIWIDYKARRLFMWIEANGHVKVFWDYHWKTKPLKQITEAELINLNRKQREYDTYVMDNGVDEGDIVITDIWRVNENEDEL